jgi:ATP-dependent DNA helicase RecG
VDVQDLEKILADLRRVQNDTQDVEAKKSARELPSSICATLSAFSNTSGGIILLGVDESGGAFKVTGVERVKAVTDALQSACAEMQPPVRTSIVPINHPNGIVICTTVHPMARNQRPCYRRTQGPQQSSYIRVADGNQRLTSQEVTEMFAGHSNDDNTSSPQKGALDQVKVNQFIVAARSRSSRDSITDVDMLKNWGVIGEDSTPTLASLLVLGDHPERTLATARLTYRKLPSAHESADVRHSGEHLEGTIGQLLDKGVAKLSSDLGTLQVERSSGLVDDSKVPKIALREFLSNALVHRSFSAQMLGVPVTVEVGDEAVLISSPGGLYVWTDPSNLGMPMATFAVRNHTLVRIAELAETPSGARIVEQQNMGIRAADGACHRANLMPALFADFPTYFRVMLLRDNLDTDSARKTVSKTEIGQDAAAIRVFAAALRLRDLLGTPGMSSFQRVPFDARFAARVLAPSTPEAATLVLGRLESAGLLERVQSRTSPYWRPASQTNVPVTQSSSAPSARKRGDHDRVPDLLDAIANSENKEMTPKAIAEALGLKSPTSRNRWIRRAENDSLIQGTSENPYAHNQTYVLTGKGEARQMQSRH